MKLSPWKTKMFHHDCYYYTVTFTAKYGMGLACVYETDENGTDEYWCDVSDLTDMRVGKFEELNELLKENFGVTTNSSGRLRLCKDAPPPQYNKEL